VYLGVWKPEHDKDAQLRVLTRADDARTARSPITDEFVTPDLGIGLRTLRHKQHDDGSLFAALRYAWRSEEHETDLQLWASSDDLGLLQRAIPDIDDFARAITVIPRSQLRRA